MWTEALVGKDELLELLGLGSDGYGRSHGQDMKGEQNYETTRTKPHKRAAKIIIS